MLDEVGLVAELFRPQESPFRARRPGFETVLLPGTHGSGVREGAKEAARYNDAVTIGAHLASSFMRTHGTAVSPARVVNRAALLDAYGFCVAYVNDDFERWKEREKEEGVTAGAH